MSTITVPRGLLERALDALEIGYESASVEAAQYHAAMAGYRQERHAAMDADVQKIAAAITALRAALAQPEQEPVPAFVHRELVEVHADGTETWSETPLYTAPPRREWRGLTMQEINALPEVGGRMWNMGVADAVLRAIRAVEQALYEKNHARADAHVLRDHGQGGAVMDAAFLEKTA